MIEFKDIGKAYVTGGQRVDALNGTMDISSAVKWWRYVGHQVLAKAHF